MVINYGKSLISFVRHENHNKIAIQKGEIMDEIDIKEIMFLVFSAGFEAGYVGKIDLAKAFNEWYDTFNKIRRE